MRVARFSLRFQLEDERQAQVWHDLCSVPSGQRNAYILDALAQYRLGKGLESTLRRVLREELAGKAAAQPAPDKNGAKARGIPSQALDFLASL